MIGRAEYRKVGRRRSLVRATAAYIVSRLVWLGIIALAAHFALRHNPYASARGGDPYGPLRSALGEVSRVLAR